MPNCKGSIYCENAVSNRSRTGKCVNCQARIRAWEDREVNEALEYQRKLRVRSDRMSYVVTETDLKQHTIEERKKARDEERAEREGEGRVDARAKGRVQRAAKGKTRKAQGKRRAA